jgi:hyperosmotically inducible periplasmic protein
MDRHWMMGVTLALLLGAPMVTMAQTTTTEPPSKSERAVEKTKEATSKATAATQDSWITAKTKIALLADDRVSGTDVRVNTQSGIVTLRGKVASADEKRVAEEVTRAVDGVSSVRNELQVVPAAERKVVNAQDKDLKNAVEKRIKQDASLKAADIDVEVDKGVVTLTGDVRDVRARVRASEVARAVPGVRAVKNELKEKTS